MKIERLTGHSLEPLKHLVEEVWRRPRSEAYYRWRYGEAPGLLTLVALEGARCVSTISAFQKQYRDGDAELACLEPFDWYTLPEMRATGVGLRLMKSLMNSGPPLVGIGGSTLTRQMLPRLGFRTVAQATQFVLPLSGAYILRDRGWPALAKNAARIVLDAAAAVWFRPARRPFMARLEFTRVAQLDAELAKIDGGTGFRSVPDPAFHEWLAKGSAVARTGDYVTVAIARRGETLGWALARLYRARGLLYGVILDLRLKRQDAELGEAAVRGVSRVLAGCGADSVRAYSTCATLSAAYRAAGFRAAEKLPAMVRSRQREVALGSVALSGVADFAFLTVHDFPAERAATAAAAPDPGLRGRMVRPSSVAAGLRDDR